MYFLIILLIGQGVRVEKEESGLFLTNIPKSMDTKVIRKQADKEPTYQNIINRIAVKYNVDAKLINLIIRAESGFNPRARSSKGAIGLMQLMPETARKLGVKNPYDPEENIEGGVRFFRTMLNRYKTVELALAAYHAGPGLVDKYGAVPPISETVAYINKILSRYSGSNRERIFTRVKGGQVILTNIPD